jgi:hypothetical protein
MAFFEKKKIKPIEIKDQFFIFAGRWFERFKEEKYEGCRLVEDASVIPEDYLNAWAGWKPSQSKRDLYGYSSSPYRSGKSF